MTENLPTRARGVPPGWYRDPAGELRWWSGERWTGQTQAPTFTEQAKRSSKAAFWSVLLGIPALLISPLALIGLPLAIVALGDIRRGAAVGQGMAWTGLILNGLVWLFWLVVIVASAVS